MKKLEGKNHSKKIIISVFIFIFSIITLSSLTASSIDSVQSGTCTISSGSNSVNCALPSPLSDLGKTFMTFQASSSNNQPRSSNVRCYLSNTNTIACERVGNVGNVNINWHTAEFSTGVSVQHLQPTCNTPITNVAITPVDMSKTFLLFSTERSGGSQSSDDFKKVRLTSPSNVEIDQSGAGCDSDEYALQVVEFADSSVTRGQTGAMSTANLGVSGLPSVDISKTLLLYSYKTSGSGPDICERMIEGKINSGTSLEFERGCSGTQIDDISWERIEFTDSTSVQQVITSMAQGIGAVNQAINPINTSTALAFAGGQWTSGQSVGKTSFSSDDVIGTAVSRHSITSNNLQVIRDDTRGTAGWTSYVVDFTATNQIPPPNQPPTANAGSDQTITLPNSATLNGVVSDDGLPSPPATVITQWSKSSGPGTVTFGDASLLTTTAAFSASGTYVLQLTANDTELSTTDSLTITVNPQTGNPPAVFISATPFFGNAPLSINFQSNVFDPEDNIVSYSWNFGDNTQSNLINPSHTYQNPGSYLVTLNVTDSTGLTGHASSTILVFQNQIPPPNQPPTANAGSDQTVTDLDNDGVEIITLDATGSTDSDGTIVSYEWREGTTVLGSTSVLSHNFPVGVHTVTLEVTDDDNAISTDTVVITVNVPSSVVFPDVTWDTRAPADVGLDGALLDQFASNVQGDGVIIKDGYLVKSWGLPDARWDWASAAKPVISTLLFFAVDDGKLSSVDDLISDWGWNLIQKDQTMTFYHLSNMISGYARGENPGDAYAYNDYAIQLYGLTMEKVFNSALNDAALQKMSVLNFEDGNIFGDSNSEIQRPGALGGLGVVASPRDYARIGWFWLNKGNWNGVQVLPQSYFDNYMKPQVASNLPRTTQPGTDYLGIGTFGGGFDDNGFGPGVYGSNLWFNSIVNITNNPSWSEAPPDMFAAIGHENNEVVTVIPSLNMVVAARGEWGRPFGPGDNNSLMNQNLKLLVDSVLSPPDPSPIVSNPQPSGNLPGGTTQVTLSVQTNEAATCKFETTPGIPYNNMVNVFSSTGGTTHTEAIINLIEGTYNYYVKCEDLANNQNTADTVISFTILQQDLSPPTTPTNLKAVPLSSSSISLDWDASTDDVGVTGYNVYRYGSIITTVSTTTYTDINLAPNFTYAYTVTATDLSGKESSHSNNATATTLNTAVSGPIASYNFNENSGSVLNDASGNGNQGTLIGGTWTTGRYGNALSFDGIDDVVTIADNPTLDYDAFSAATFSFWAKPDVLASSKGDEMTAFSQYGDSSDRPVYIFISGSTNRWKGCINNCNGGDTEDSSAIVPGNWYHVAVVWVSGTSLNLYIDGQLVGTDTTSVAANMDVSSVSHGIGARTRTPFDEFFDGTIDEVRIYDRALSQTEIQSVMNAPI